MNSEVLTAILDSLIEPVVYVDMNHIIRFVNKAAVEKYGKRGHFDLVGKPLFNYHGEKSKQRIIDLLNGLPEEDDERFISVNAANYKIYLRVVRDNNGSAIGYYERFEKVEG